MSQINQKKAVMKKVMRVETIYDKKILFAIKIAGGVILTGPAGVGKTSSLEHIAREEGWRVVFYQCHPQTDGSELLYQLIPDDKSRSGIRRIDGVLVRAIKSAKEGRDTILILDEWDKTRPSMDAFLLDFIQNKRISVPDMEMKLEDGDGKLYVALTSNAMRELSEPLLRRLPVIYIDHLPPSLVREALKLSHPNSLYIEPAVKLYVMTLKAGIEKPATIQELRQLLTAIETLGDDADWDELVRIYVTKTEENHRRLKEIEREFRGVPIEWSESESEKLDPAAYEDTVTIKEVEEETPRPKLPRPKVIEKRDNTSPTERDLQKASVIAPHSEKDLTATVRVCDYDTKRINIKESFIIASPKIKVRTKEDATRICKLLEKFSSDTEIEVAVLKTLPIKKLTKVLVEDLYAKVKKIVKGGFVLVYESSEIYITSERKYVYIIGNPDSVKKVVKELEDYLEHKEETGEIEEKTLAQVIKKNAFDGYSIKDAQVTLEDIRNIEKLKGVIEEQVGKKVQEIKALSPLERMEEIEKLYSTLTPGIAGYNIRRHFIWSRPPIYKIEEWTENIKEYLMIFAMFSLTKKLSSDGILMVRKVDTLHRLYHEFIKSEGKVEFRVYDEERKIETIEIEEAVEVIWNIIKRIASHIKWLLEGEK